MPHDYKLIINIWINKLVSDSWKELKQTLLSRSKQQPRKTLILSIFI